MKEASVATKNGYTFTTYEDGSVKAEGRLQSTPASRSGMHGITPAGYDSARSDKGHLVAARHNGPVDSANIHTQNTHVNRSTFSTIENQESRLLAEGCTVETERIACVDQPGSAPTAFIINDTVTAPDGQTQTVHEYVENFSPEEQAEWEAEFQEWEAENSSLIDESESPLPEGMTAEEYQSILSEVESESDLSIQADYDIGSWSSCSFDNASDGPDNGMDGGADA